MLESVFSMSYISRKLTISLLLLDVNSRIFDKFSETKLFSLKNLII